MDMQGGLVLSITMFVAVSLEYRCRPSRCLLAWDAVLPTLPSSYINSP